jgi:hypothetical protein
MRFFSERVTCVPLMIAALPQALNQNPQGALGLLRTAAFSVLLGLMAYIGAFWVMWIPMRLFWRRPYKALHKAALVWGIACSLLLPSMYIVAINPGDSGGIIEVSLMVLILISGAVMSFGILARSKREPNRTS